MNEIELKNAMDADPKMEEMRQEFAQLEAEIKSETASNGLWEKIKRLILNRCDAEAYLSREMYIRGFFYYERLVGKGQEMERKRVVPFVARPPNRSGQAVTSFQGRDMAVKYVKKAGKNGKMD